MVVGQRAVELLSRRTTMKTALLLLALATTGCMSNDDEDFTRTCET
jgi:hypothetical protein